MTGPRLRFAPSPTGDLHPGSALVAVANAIARNKLGGELVLRIDDTDETRTVPGAEERLAEALEWLGVRFDESPLRGGPHDPYRQSERTDLYLRRAESAVEAGIARRLPDGAVVLDPPESVVTLVDLTRGPITVGPEAIGETVLVRSSGRPTYHLATVVDDDAMRISHVLRGGDHIANTARQVATAEALGLAVPAWAHLPLLVGEDGRPLSKRDAATGVAALRERGVPPEAVWAVLARLACPAVPAGTWDRRAIERSFDLARLGRGVVRLDRKAFASASRGSLGALDDAAFGEQVGRELARLGVPVAAERIAPLLPGLRGGETIRGAAEAARDVFVAAPPAPAPPGLASLLEKVATEGAQSGEALVQAVAVASGLPRREVMRGLRAILLGGRRGVPVALAMDALGPEEVARRAHRAVSAAPRIREDSG